MAVLNTGGQQNLAMISQNSQNGKRDLSSIHVRQLTKSEIQSLRESKREAYERMMKLD